MGTKTLSDERRRTAELALEALGDDRPHREILVLQCSHAHHLVSVFDTEKGPVFVARTGPHAHGRKDFVDTGHRGAPGGTEYVDLLVSGGPSEDDLVAWCDCGPRVLSRIDVMDHIRLGHHTVLLP